MSFISHYKRAHGAMIVYDITEQFSYECVQRWVDEVRSNAEPETVILLVGNKLDKCEGNHELRKISKSSAEEYAKANNMLFAECSAESSTNVHDAFESLLHAIANTPKPTVNEISIQSMYSGNHCCVCEH